MEKTKTTLGTQKKVIIILACLAAVLLAAYFLIGIFFKEEQQTVLRVDEYGDSVEAVITDYSARGITISHIRNVLDGKEENKFNVKKGETEDVLCTFNADDVEISYFPLVFPEIPLDEIESIKVTNPYGEYTVGYDAKNATPYIVGAEMNLYNQQELATLVLQARYMLCDRRVDFSGNLADYGLDAASVLATVEVKSTDGTVNTVYIGSLTHGGNGYYMKHKDKDKIYIGDSTVSIFFNAATYFLSPVITKAIPEEERNYIEKMTFSKNREPFFSCEIIPEDERVGALVNQLHRMTYPTGGYIVNTYSLYEMFSQIGALSGVSVLEYNVSKNEAFEDILVYYGFDKQSAEITFSYKGAQHTVTVGGSVTDEESDEKYYYVYSTYMDTIVLLPLSSAPFLEYELIDFIQAKVFQHNINDISSVEILTRGNTREFVLEGEKNDLAVTEKKSGKSIDSASFRQFFISLLNVNLDGYSSVKQDDELDHELTFTVNLKSGEKLTYAFYSESTLRCYMVVDGKGEFYTKREYIDKISRNADKLMSGETIESGF